MIPAATILPEHPLKPGEVYDRKNARIVIERDDYAFVVDQITGGVLSTFPSATTATSWGAGCVPVEDRREGKGGRA